MENALSSTQSNCGKEPTAPQPRAASRELQEICRAFIPVPQGGDESKPLLTPHHNPRLPSWHTNKSQVTNYQLMSIASEWVNVLILVIKKICILSPQL